jgi:hypothetical protein
MPVALFQELFVNGLNRFPVQVQMVGHFDNRHHLAELIYIICQPSSDPDIGVKQFQILDADPLADRAKQLAVAAVQPDFSGCQV